ncbi:MAG: FtsX-like permease family protein [Bacteroidia bacterium]|nr:FtsX-like permease family protein [Bacteroidia bacterium]
MLRNYFRVAFRNILKHKFFSAINIAGMAIGITSCLLIVLYVADEMSYDKFHHDADRIYQVGLHGRLGGQDIMVANTCPPLAAALVNEVTAVEASTRIAQYFGQAVIKYEDKAFTEQKVLYVDSNFFDFFNFKLIEGDPETALTDPATVVITKDMATKYFGDEPGMGKLFTIGNDNRSFKVTGVTENPPANSHFTFHMLISASSADFLQSTIWLNNFLYTYFKLHENASPDQVNDKYNELVEKYVGPEVERFMGTPLEEMRKQGGAYGYLSTKLTDIHLHSKVQGDVEPGGDITYVYLFASIGVFIVIIACINFMNLSTARSAGRAKEVGLRKTLGSLRGQMIGQFLAESMVYAFIAVVMAIVACYFLLPSFNLLSGKELGMQVLLSPRFIGSVIALVVFVGLVSGSYPAFYLTSFNAVEVLKGKVRAGMRSKAFAVCWWFCSSCCPLRLSFSPSLYISRFSSCTRKILDSTKTMS